MLCSMLAGFVLVFCMSGSSGFPRGAPESSCFYARPGHMTSSQTTEPPYKIEVDPPEKEFYKPEEEIKVTISIKWGNSPFKGFLLQARSSTEINSKIIGTFRRHNSYLRTTKNVCEEDGHSALTHSTETSFWRVSGFWNAPADYQGDVIFVAAVVKSYKIFWVDLHSKRLKIFPEPTSLPTLESYLNTTDLCHESLVEGIPAQRPHVAIMCNTAEDCPCGWKCCAPCDVTENCSNYAICRKPRELQDSDKEKQQGAMEGKNSPDRVDEEDDEEEEVNAFSVELEE